MNDAVQNLLNEAGHLLVRRALLRDNVADVIYDVAGSRQRDWTLTEWKLLLKELDNCSQTVSQWIEENYVSDEASA